jgi:integrase
MPWARQHKRSHGHDEYRLVALKTFFGARALGDISPLLIEKYKRHRAAQKTKRGGYVQPGTINNELALLSRVFTMAVDAGQLLSNPCSRVRRLRCDNVRERHLSREEEEDLLAHVADRQVRAVVEVALGTGMRMGEVRSLEWSRVDFSRGRLLVTNTKTGKDRFVPMSVHVTAVLEALWAEGSDSPLVFPGPKKSHLPVSKSHVWGVYKRACADAGLKGLRFHDLRHTAATRMAEHGSQMRDIQAVLGHANITMTARYTHPSDEGMRRAVETIFKPESKGNGHNVVTLADRKVG